MKHDRTKVHAGKRMGHRFLLLMICLLPNVMAHGQATLFGRVTDIDSGENLPGARVALIADGSEHLAATAWTDAAGRYALPDVPPGRWRVEVQYFSEAIRYAVAAPVIRVAHGVVALHFAVPTTSRAWLGTPDPSPFPAKDGSAIIGLPRSGRVVDARGRVLPESRTTIETLTDGLLHGTVSANHQPIPDAVVRLGKQRETRTDGRGAFEFDHVRDGRYDLRVEAHGRRYEMPKVKVRIGPNEVNVDLAVGG